MNKKLTVKTIVLAEKRGTVLLTDQTDPKTPPTCTAALSFSDPKEAVKIEQGAVYEFTLKKAGTK